MLLAEEIHKHVDESSAYVSESFDGKYQSLLQWYLLCLLYRHPGLAGLFELSLNEFSQSQSLRRDYKFCGSFYNDNPVMVLYPFCESIFLGFHSKGTSVHQDEGGQEAIGNSFQETLGQ